MKLLVEEALLAIKHKVEKPPPPSASTSSVNPTPTHSIRRQKSLTLHSLVAQEKLQKNAKLPQRGSADSTSSQKPLLLQTKSLTKSPRGEEYYSDSPIDSPTINSGTNTPNRTRPTYHHSN